MMIHADCPPVMALRTVGARETVPSGVVRAAVTFGSREARPDEPEDGEKCEEIESAIQEKERKAEVAGVASRSVEVSNFGFVGASGNAPCEDRDDLIIRHRREVGDLKIVHHLE
jgi:hypothetical protein